MDPAPIVGEVVNHPDHRAVALASLDVTLTAGTTPGHFPELLAEGLDPWRGLRELWLMGPGRRSRGIDITPVMDRKIKALMCHTSQVGEDSGRIEGWMRSRAAELGEPFGYDYAETFDVIARGPGFHAEEVDEEIDFADPPVDPASAPVRPST